MAVYNNTFKFLIIYTAKKGNPGDASFSEVVIIREVGGVMAPIWQSYIEPGKTNAILYVVDASSPETLGTSTIHLLELLNHTSVANITPILIVFRFVFSTNCRNRIFYNKTFVHNMKFSKFQLFL